MIGKSSRHRPMSFHFGRINAAPRLPRIAFFCDARTGERLMSMYSKFVLVAAEFADVIGVVIKKNIVKEMVFAVVV